MRYHKGFKKKIGLAAFYTVLTVTLALGLGLVADIGMRVAEMRQETVTSE